MTMWLPIAVVPTIIPAGIAAIFSHQAANTVRPLASALVVANGLQGTFFPCRGVLQKSGGGANLRHNIEMGPPAFAPLCSPAWSVGWPSSHHSCAARVTDAIFGRPVGAVRRPTGGWRPILDVNRAVGLIFALTA